MTHHLAQLNIAEPAAPLDGPQLAGFVALLPEINELADRSPGFVWRLHRRDRRRHRLRPFGPTTMVNMSVWESVEALRDYTYRSAHLRVLQRRREWFEPLRRALPRALVDRRRARGRRWPRPRGGSPDLDEHGPTPEAFTFRASSRRPVRSPRDG